LFSRKVILNVSDSKNKDVQHEPAETPTNTFYKYLFINKREKIVFYSKNLLNLFNLNATHVC